MRTFGVLPVAIPAFRSATRPVTTRPRRVVVRPPARRSPLEPVGDAGVHPTLQAAMQPPNTTPPGQSGAARSQRGRPGVAATAYSVLQPLNGTPGRFR